MILNAYYSQNYASINVKAYPGSVAHDKPLIKASVQQKNKEGLF